MVRNYEYTFKAVFDAAEALKTAEQVSQNIANTLGAIATAGKNTTFALAQADITTIIKKTSGTIDQQIEALKHWEATLNSAMEAVTKLRQANAVLPASAQAKIPLSTADVQAGLKAVQDAINTAEPFRELMEQWLTATNDVAKDPSLVHALQVQMLAAGKEMLKARHVLAQGAPALSKLIPRDFMEPEIAAVKEAAEEAKKAVDTATTSPEVAPGAKTAADQLTQMYHDITEGSKGATVRIVQDEKTQAAAIADLTRISGIGEARAKKFIMRGYTTAAALTGIKPEKFVELAASIGVSEEQLSNFMKQARLLPEYLPDDDNNKAVGWFTRLAGAINNATMQYFGIRRLGYGMSEMGRVLERYAGAIVQKYKEWAAAFIEYSRQAERAAAAMQLPVEMYETYNESLLQVAATAGMFDPASLAQGLYVWASGTGDVVNNTSDLEKLYSQLIPVMMLARRHQLDLGETANYVGGAIANFGLTTADTAHVVETFNDVADRTRSTVDDVGNAYTYLGPLAGEMGVSFDEMSTALGLLSDENVRASKAGRGLQQIFIQMLDPTRETNLIMNELLGVSHEYNDEWRKFIFPNDKFIGFAEYIDILASATENLTDKQREESLAGIATANEIKSLIPLVSREIKAREYGVNIIRANTKRRLGLIDEEVERLIVFEREVEGTTPTVLSAHEAWALSWRSFAKSAGYQIDLVTNRLKVSAAIAGSAIFEKAAPAITQLTVGLLSIARLVDKYPQVFGVGLAFAAVVGVSAVVFKTVGVAAGIVSNLLILAGTWKAMKATEIAEATAKAATAAVEATAATEQLAAASGQGAAATGQVAAAAGQQAAAATQASAGGAAAVKLLGAAGILGTVAASLSAAAFLLAPILLGAGIAYFGGKALYGNEIKTILLLKEFSEEQLHTLGEREAQMKAFGWAITVGEDKLIKLVDAQGNVIREATRLDVLRAMSLQKALTPEQERELQTLELEIDWATGADPMKMFEEYFGDSEEYLNDQLERWGKYQQGLQQVGPALPPQDEEEQARLSKWNDFLGNLLDTYKDFRKEMADADKQYDKQQREAARQLAKDLVQYWEDYQEKLADLEADLANDLAKLEADNNKSKAEAYEKLLESQQDADEERAKAFEELWKKHRDALWELAVERDAYGIVKEMRAYKNEREQIQDNWEEKREDAQEEYEKELADIAEQGEEKRQELLEQYRKNKADALKNYNEQVAERRERYNEELADMKAAHEEQEQEIIAAARERLNTLLEAYRNEELALATSIDNRLDQLRRLMDAEYEYLKWRYDMSMLAPGAPPEYPMLPNPGYVEPPIMYASGGYARQNRVYRLAEKGPEYVIDANTTRALERQLGVLSPNVLLNGRGIDFGAGAGRHRGSGSVLVRGDLHLGIDIKGGQLPAGSEDAAAAMLEQLFTQVTRNLEVEYG